MAIAIGGKVFDHGDVEIDFLGNRPVNFKGVEITESEDFELAYGKGKTPIGWSSGNYEYGGKVNLGQDEISAIRKAAGGSILRIRPFNMTITVINDDNTPMVYVVLCKFISDGFNSNSGDKDLAQELELGVISVNLNEQL